VSDGTEHSEKQHRETGKGVCGQGRPQ
jgi:hypothetical protein